MRMTREMSLWQRTIQAKLSTVSYFVYACSETLVGLHICYLTICKMATCNSLALKIDSEIIFKVANRNKRYFTWGPVAVDIWGTRSKITTSYWPNPNAIVSIAIRQPCSIGIVYNMYWKFKLIYIKISRVIQVVACLKNVFILARVSQS